MRRFFVVLSAVIGLALCVGLTSASARPLRWSGINQLQYSGGIALGSIACEGQSNCVALDAYGRVARLELHSSSPPDGQPRSFYPVVLGTPGQPSAIACPNVNCTAVTDTGGETTFDLKSPTHHARYDRVDPGASAARTRATPGLACPSPTLCVIADDAGNIVTLSPTDPQNATRTALDPGGSLVAVACPTATQCTAISQTEQWTFDPRDPATHVTATIETGTGQATALACPSTAQCTSVDASGRETTFDPQTATAGTPVAVSISPKADDSAVVCLTTTACIAADRDGNLDSFDPETGASISQTPTANLDDLACASATECIADTSTGSAELVTPGALKVGTPLPVDGGRPLLAVSCPSATRCVTVDYEHEITFDPKSSSARSYARPYVLLGFGQPVTGIACPLTSLCSAVRGNAEVRFDPGDYHAADRYHDLHSAGTIVAVRCPRQTECVGIDSKGTAVTYDPSTGQVAHSHIDVDANRALTALACPSTSQCTATDDDGTATSFDPLTGRRLTRLTIDRGIGLDTRSGGSDRELDGIACDSTRACVAVDSRGDVVSFDPASPRGIKRDHVDNLAGLTAVACPTDGLCVLAGADGRVFTGRPYATRWTPTRLLGAVALDAITCVNATDCVAVDAAGAEFASH